LTRQVKVKKHRRWFGMAPNRPRCLWIFEKALCRGGRLDDYVKKLVSSRIFDMVQKSDQCKTTLPNSKIKITQKRL